MKQRHSYTNLLYHMVFRTKRREHLILTARDEDALFGFIKAKAHHIDAYVEENGAWREHVHLLVRARSTMALSEVYRQLKGFSSRSWNRRFSDRPFGWADGVWAVTVSPGETTALREYIRHQRSRHDARALVVEWEPVDETEK
jgi:REP element-mobilizing transposase RayT